LFLLQSGKYSYILASSLNPIKYL